MSKLAQYLQLVVWQIFVDLPFLPKVGLSGMLERTSKSRSRGFPRAPQVSLESYRSLVRSEVPSMVQFRLGNWWILGFFLVMLQDKEELVGGVVRVVVISPLGGL